MRSRHALINNAFVDVGIKLFLLLEHCLGLFLFAFAPIQESQLVIGADMFRFKLDRFLKVSIGNSSIGMIVSKAPRTAGAHSGILSESTR